MEQKTQRTVLGLLAAVAVLALGWAVWRGFGGRADESPIPSRVTVLCANEKCQYFGEIETKKLVLPAGGHKRPARNPTLGPGYKCPKCGEDTLYPDPVKCSACGAFFFVGRDATARSCGSVPSARRSSEGWPKTMR